MKIIVGENERAILCDKKIFKKILLPGEYSFFFSSHLTYEIHSLDVPECRSSFGETILKNHTEVSKKYFDVFQTKDSEIAIIKKDGFFYDILAPGRQKIYWKGYFEMTSEKIDLQEKVDISDEVILSSLERCSLPQEFALVQVVPEGYAGLLYIDGKFERSLEAGKHGFWSVLKKPNIVFINLHLQQKEVSGQEVLTKDKVGIRANVDCFYRITDPVKVGNDMENFDDYLYKKIQLTLREVASAKTLEEILIKKGEVAQEALKELQDCLKEKGVFVEEIAVKDIILPGDMREIMNEVLRAEKHAQANVIKRREEAAATRSLLNTAKLMEENPILMRLKELETIEKALEKVGSITVNGGLDGILKDLLGEKK